jgi:hypothetical protein
MSNNAYEKQQFFSKWHPKDSTKVGFNNEWMRNAVYISVVVYNDAAKGE